jgi:hypothetical protein
MEDNLGEGSWWNGYTMSSNEWGGVTEDKDIEGNDMREITVGVNIPLDGFNKERMNQAIGWKIGETIGGVQQEDFASDLIYKPEGAKSANSTPQSYQRINGNVFSSTASFGQDSSDADFYTQVYTRAIENLQNNPNFKGKSQSEIANFADEYTRKKVAERR